MLKIPIVQENYTSRRGFSLHNDNFQSIIYAFLPYKIQEKLLIVSNL